MLLVQRWKACAYCCLPPANMSFSGISIRTDCLKWQGTYSDSSLFVVFPVCVWCDTSTYSFATSYNFKIRTKGKILINRKPTFDSYGSMRWAVSWKVSQTETEPGRKWEPNICGWWVVSMSLSCIPNLSLDEEDATAGVEVRLLTWLLYTERNQCPNPYGFQISVGKIEKLLIKYIVPSDYQE